MKRNASGFTLIEIAIVLVIIGLLLGGVLKGQELITGARVRNLISQQDGIKAAFFGFQDRFRALPGDYAAASTNINGVTINGDGNGRIEGPNVPGTYETLLAWNHLTSAGFLNGSYTLATSTTSTAVDTNNPKNPYSVYIQIIYDANYGVTAGKPLKHNLKTGNQVPVEIVAEVDRKIDDGLPDAGGFQFSPYVPSGTALTAASCTTAGTPTTWLITGAGGGNTNCGGASLF
ncbi:MAG TPA: prepilin-type N-terminal cleavage/methylation domain-containing protein [Burkholderiales bacterium]|jgi:prepilin-type N-terminal cleavage/methylation domain-containing protein|nr:prepilin-type N-terminal cleavage/methylation domain-containing protein [Burkholderiales bacterium]